MKRICIILTMMMVASWMTAQEKMIGRRGHIENVSDYNYWGIPTGKRRIGSLATAALPSFGSPKIPVILVQFSDRHFSVGETEEEVNEQYQQVFNAGENIHPGTSYCSAKEYFRNQSENLFTPDFDIIGPVTLEKSYTYYGEDSGGHHDIHISDFYRDACQKAIQQNVDWSLYDNNQNGTVDLVFFIYAGPGENGDDGDEFCIWPKESVTQQVVTGDDFTVTFSAYGCTNELFGKYMDGIGTCIHELCHGLGLPDFYDTNYASFGMDYWDVMDAGCYQIGAGSPIELSAYERDFFNWRKLVELHPDSAYSLTILPLELGGVGYKVVNREKPNEYFILENRQNIGLDKYMGWATMLQFEEYGSNHGLMITHVDFDQSAWNSNNVNTKAYHQRMTIVPADGELVSSIFGYDSKWANSICGDLYPGAKKVTEMSSYAVFTGESLGQTITNIVEHEDGRITLDINGGKGKPEEDENSEPDIPEIA